MTAYTFIASASQEFVNWNTPSVWAGGMFPNSTSADVIIPEITTTRQKQIQFNYYNLKRPKLFGQFRQHHRQYFGA